MRRRLYTPRNFYGLSRGPWTDTPFQVVSTLMPSLFLASPVTVGRARISFTLHPARRQALFKAISRAICRATPFYVRRSRPTGISSPHRYSVRIGRGEKVQRTVPAIGIFPSYIRCGFTEYRLPLLGALFVGRIWAFHARLSTTPLNLKTVPAPTQPQAEPMHRTDLFPVSKG
jgi:hypothetical protein